MPANERQSYKNINMFNNTENYVASTESDYDALTVSSGLVTLGGKLRR